ncbi:hypothetical protein BJY01DRAFT_248492 [Aspergillus pseudoustus]|uniref:Uncharacterized protein n=1 Tax=Aspergillus pseudoustus TaxID=1810923 RepID=A0ABR4JV63_9EURO
MGVFIVTLLLALIATMTSAQHTVNCWGKSLHPEHRHVKDAIKFLSNTIANSHPEPVRGEGHGCTETYCIHKTSVRYCNDATHPRLMPLQNILDSVTTISRDCVSEFNGKKVAGGVVDHADQWSVVVQKDDNC